VNQVFRLAAFIDLYFPTGEGLLEIGSSRAANALGIYV